MRHAPVSISFSTRDLLSFFSFRAHLLGGGRRPPERTRLNSAVRHQLGSRFVLPWGDRKSTRLNSSHGYISYAVFCLKKKKKKNTLYTLDRVIILQKDVSRKPCCTLVPQHVCQSTLLTCLQRARSN